MTPEIQQAITDAVVKAFSVGIDNGRYIDVSRIPLICQSIVGIDSKLEEIVQNAVTQDQFWPVKTIVYGITGMILAAAVGALLVLVFKQNGL